MSLQDHRRHGVLDRLGEPSLLSERAVCILFNFLASLGLTFFLQRNIMSFSPVENTKSERLSSAGPAGGEVPGGEGEPKSQRCRQIVSCATCRYLRDLRIAHMERDGRQRDGLLLRARICLSTTDRCPTGRLRLKFTKRAAKVPLQQQVGG